MTDPRNMSVKAYMTSPNGSEEVRRFGIPEGASTSFSYLEERVRDIFGLGTGEFKIHWQDSEGDHILISSDEELFEAISECIMHQEQKFLRIYVSVNGSKAKKTDESSDKGIHAGVVCDGCNGPISGVRFKCKVCPDYDLCSSCNNKGIHKHHQFMRISDRAGIDITINTDGFINDTPLFSGCGWGRGGGRNRGFRREHQHQHHHHQQQQHSFHPFFAGDGQGRRDDRPKPFQFFNNSAAGGFPVFGLGTGFAAPNPDMTFPGADKIAEEAGKFASQMATQHVADIMKGMWSAWTGNMEASQSQRDQDSERASGENTPMEDDTQEKKTESSDNVGVSVPKAKSTTESDNEKSKPESLNDVILIDAEESHRPQSGQNSPSGAEDWTLLNKEKDASHESSQNVTPRETIRSNSTDGATQRQIYPNLPTAPSAPSVPHPNPRVNSALEQMQGMGYSDEGGWLTRLLEMKDGDINKVLDMLLVQKK